MPQLIVRALMLCAMVACAKPDGAARRADSTATHTTPASTAGAAAAPHDSITDLADRGRIMGDPNAKVWVLMASDFQCPYCKAWHDAQFTKLVDGYVKSGRIHLAFVNMPLSMHPNAVPAAEAAMCASVQNKFWPMHESLFSSQSSWEELSDPKAKFDSLATAAGVDMPSWRTCVAQHLTLGLIQADHDRIRNTGVNSTPTFFVGGKMITNAQGESAGAGADVGAAIDAALKGSGGKPST